MPDDKTDPREANEDQAKVADSPKAEPKTAKPDADSNVGADLDALLAENAEMRDRLLRTMADMENLAPPHRAGEVRHRALRHLQFRPRRADGRRQSQAHHRARAGRGRGRRSGAEELPRRGRADRARAAQRAGAPRRHPHRAARPALRPELPSGHVRGARTPTCRRAPWSTSCSRAI